jgi:magnesium transporter
MADVAGVAQIAGNDLGSISAIQRSIKRDVKQGDSLGAIAQLEGLAAPAQAHLIADLDERSRRAILGSLPPEGLAQILQHLHDDHREVTLTGAVDVDRLAAALDGALPNVAADVLRGMSLPEATEIMARMRNAAIVGDLLTYRADEAGSLMTPEVLGLRDSLNAAHALQVVKSSGYRPRFMRNLFVIDRDSRLVGRLELSDLIVAASNAKLSDFMDTEVVSVLTGTDKEECARLMERYQLRSVPVVDTERRLQGVITVEDLVKVAEEEATEDMYRLVGTDGQDRPIGPLWPSIKYRFPWLMVQLASVIAAGMVVGLFEPAISKLAILAVFIPIIVGQADIAGEQTVTVVVRSLALQDVTSRDARRMMLRELALALSQGIATALILSLICWFWREDAYLSTIIGLSMLLSLLIAGATGVLVPLGLKVVKVDPATASAVIITTITDLIGLVAYLGMATLFLSYFRGVG